MRIDIVPESAASLPAYSTIPASFLVDRIVQPSGPGADGFVLRERPLATPYVKDYDALDGGRAGPIDWPSRFDLSRWRLLAAYIDGHRVGGSAVALGTLELTEGRDDLAVLWDIRVAPHARRAGVGGALFRAAEAIARDAACRELMTETQNVNAPACRFYARQGCVLRAVRAGAYPNLPDEVQLLLYKVL